MNKLKSIIKSNKKQIKNFLIYAITDGLSQALPFLVLPFIAETLGSEQFGIVANLTVLVELYLALLGMRLVFYYSADYYQVDQNKRAILITNISFFYLIGGLIIAVFSYFFTHLIASSFYVPVLWQYLTLFMVFNLLLGQLLTTDLRMAEKAREFGLVQFIRSFLSAGLSILFIVVIPFGWEGRAIAMLISALFLGTVALWYFKKVNLFSNKIDFELQKKLLFFGLPMLPYALSPWLKNGIEKLFITQQVSLSENGVYSLAISLGSVFGIVSSSFFSTYTPIMYKILSNKEHQDLGKKRLVKQSYFVLVGFFVIMSLGFFLLSYLIKTFFSSDYHGAISFLPYILLSDWLGVIINLLKSVIIYSKETKLLGVLGLLLTLVQIPLTYVLILHYKTIGAPIAGLIGSLMMLVGYYFISQKYVKMPWFYFVK